jgi:hypothetical protein
LQTEEFQLDIHHNGWVPDHGLTSMGA